MTRIKNKSYALATGLLLLAGCAGPNMTEPLGESAQAARVGAAQLESVGALGDGYSVEKESFAGRCVEGTLVYGGAPEGNLELVLDNVYERLRDEFNLEAQCKAKFSSFDLNAQAKVAMTAQESSSKMSLAYLFTTRGKNAMLVDLKATEMAKEARSRGKDAVKEACSEQFVQQVELGAKLVVVLTIDLSNTDMKSHVNGKLKLNVLKIFEAEGEVDLTNEGVNERTKINLTAYQLGGDPSKLPNLFTSTECNEKKKECTAAVSCSAKDITACQAAMQGVMLYARKEFPEQLEGMQYNPKTFQGPAILGYVTKSYKEAGLYDILDEDSPTVELAVKHARTSLFDRMATILRDKDRVALLLNGSYWLQGNEQARLEEVQKRIAQQIEEVRKAANVCYNQIGECIQAVKKMEEQFALIRYDAEELVRIPGFYEYCMKVDDSEAMGMTVTAIQERLGVQTGMGNQDVCREGMLRLQEAPSLDVSNRGISDLRPLRTARKLKELNLSDNDIQNLGPLEELTELVTLKLRNNKVSYIAPLVSLKKLRELDLAGTKDVKENRIGDFSPLEQLPLLRDLNIFQHDNIYWAPIHRMVDARGLITKKEFDLFNTQYKDFKKQIGTSGEGDCFEMALLWGEILPVFRGFTDSKGLTDRLSSCSQWGRKEERMRWFEEVEPDLQKRLDSLKDHVNTGWILFAR